MVLIGEKIRGFRESKKLSQEFVADYLGISQSAYSKIESGQTNLSAMRISSLANLFDVPEHEFFHHGDNLVFNNNTITYAYISTFVENQKSAYESVIDILKEQLSKANDEKKELLEILKNIQTKGNDESSKIS
jgi:transcriptional regulator with XRE-family HTH domain